MDTASDSVAYPPHPTVDRASLPPGPPEWPVVGQAFRYLFDPVGLIREAAGYGDLVTLSTKGALVFLVNHPELVRELFISNHQNVGRGRLTQTLQYLLGNGLVTADGPFHLRQRRLMQPHFGHSRISEYAKVMVDFSLRHEEKWKDGARVDLAEEMSELTLHIVVRTLFGLELSDTVRRIGQAFEISNGYVRTRDNQPPALRQLFHRLPFPLTRRFNRALAYLDNTVYGLIAQRRQSGLEGSDLLSLLLNARDEQVGDPDAAAMTDQQLRDEVITLFAAGHETTAVALTWTWYLLATHPDVQARFHAELDEILGGRRPGPNDLPRLPYTERVLTESMRLYPPIWSTGRMTFQPITLGGWQIPAGALLVAPQLILHGDPRWFDDPLQFRPDRWTPEFKEQLPRFAFYPFGGGPRLCIGEGFAWMEAMIVLATLGQRWTMHHDPEHRIELVPMVSLRPRGGMPTFLERRSSDIVGGTVASPTRHQNR